MQILQKTILLYQFKKKSNNRWEQSREQGNKILKMQTTQKSKNYMKDIEK